MLRRATAVTIMMLVLGAAIPARLGFGQSASGQKFPDVAAVKVSPRGADVFDFDVTMTSPYDTAQRYADGFQVSADGVVLGARVLFHDHADEQPFTRDLHGVKIPPGVRSVVVQGRDKANGYGGASVEVALPGR